MTVQPTYSPFDDDIRPPDDGLTDAEREARDRADDETERQIQHRLDVANKVHALRVLEEARQILRDEKNAERDYSDQYLTRRQLEELPAPEPLIERVLPRHAYAILRGRDHSLKSFTAIDWSLCLATGKHWLGHDVHQVPVLYIAGEGAHGLRKRIDAWEYVWGKPVPDHMLTIRKTALNLHQPGPAFDHLLAHIAERRYGLVVVDTLRRVSGAADGNSSEMGVVIDNLDRIKQATDDGTVLAVAHTDKGDNDTRGYSGIEDDADVVWAAKRDDMALTLQLTKMKDGPDGTVIHLIANRTLQSLVLSGTEGPVAGNTTESQIKILDALRLIPGTSTSGAELMTMAGLSKTTFYRALKDLIDTNQIVLEQAGRTKYYTLPAATLGVDLSDADTPDDDQDNPTDPTLDEEAE